GGRDVQAAPVPALSHAHAGGKTMTATKTKVRLATVWLDGCSGCHMSLLDTDERLLALARDVTVVWGPLVDAKEFPENVVVTLGDCAITGNVSAMRNNFGANAVLKRAYLENATLDAQIPRQVIPALNA